MKPIGPIETAPLFPVLHEKLIDLLRSLSPDDWHRDTICAGWTVKDVVSHLLDTSLRTITLYRDGYPSPKNVAIHSYRDLVDYLNRLNNDWVRSTRRLSPRLLVDWLDDAGRTADALVMGLSPDEPAIYSVAWAGQAESPNWFHIAREYTERWHHQQQIQLSVGQQEALLTDELYQPLLDTFMRALPHAYREVSAPTGTLLRVSVPALNGGDWWLHRLADRWALVLNETAIQPDVTVRIDRVFAWQLFTRNLPTQQATAFVQIEGDEALGRQVLATRSVMM
ncbi:maleylpyruvate isomerase N-terminal domain-containing protein [Fibrella sp. WM1]|uniref:maleylpyruvate isomerase N-terminal domain-containing protein n=1 Tax=Fibrella musci TaxID=3242485 RepID=UPI00351F91CF